MSETQAAAPTPSKFADRGGMHAARAENPQKAAARAIYEAMPGSTCEAVAQETGVPVGTIRRWKSEQKWKPAARTIPDLTGRAGDLANTFKVKMSELGKPMSDEVAVQEVSRELSKEHAVNVRAAVLDRHRKEWAAPRRLAYTALQKGQENKVAEAFELAKLAKITSETLQIIQVGECRAFGLDHGARGQDGGTVVMIERDGSPSRGEIPVPGEDAAEQRISEDGEVG